MREQFWLAAGRPLSAEAIAASERAAEPAGHAIEVRIAAEDPSRAFVPTPGLIRRWAMPAGPGVRVDTAIVEGDRIPPEYDNLIAKLMVHAGDRPAAVRRLRRALDETEIAGIQTTLPFHRFVARHRAFLDGELSTGWVGDWWDGPAELARARRVALLAAGLDALAQGLATAPGAASPVTPTSERLGRRRPARGDGPMAVMTGRRTSTREHGREPDARIVDPRAVRVGVVASSSHAPVDGRS